jgi:anti-sigma B factor antagonist
MPQPYAIESEPIEIAGRSGRVFHVSGNIGAEATEELELASQAALDDGTRHIIVDFAGAGYISSGVLRLLLTLRKATRQIGGSVQVAAVCGHIREHVFDALGFSKLFTLYENVEEAIQNVGENT